MFYREAADILQIWMSVQQDNTAVSTTVSILLEATSAGVLRATRGQEITYVQVSICMTECRCR